MEIKGKKVLVVGLGKSGLAAALFLRHHGAQVTVSDLRSAEALAKEIPALIEEGIAVEAGGHGLLTFRRQDLIVVSPGVPIDTPELDAGAEIRASDHRRAGAGGALSARQSARDYRIEWQNYYHLVVRRDSRGREGTGAGGRQHRRAGHRPGGSFARRRMVGAGSFELPAGDDLRISSGDRGNPQHHARSPGPARHL